MSQQLVLISKADRKWQNISHYQDKRAQGRSSARNAAPIVGAGTTAMGIGYGATKLDPAMFGSFKQAGEGLKATRQIASDTHLFNRTMRQAGAPMKGANRKLVGGTLKNLGRVAAQNPGVALAGLGAGAVGAGSAMWVAGRTKARNADRKIEQLRRQRGRRYGLT